MRTYKRIICGAVAAVMTLSVSSCAKKAGGGDGKTDSGNHDGDGLQRGVETVPAHRHHGGDQQEEAHKRQEEMCRYLSLPVGFVATEIELRQRVRRGHDAVDAATVLVPDGLQLVEEGIVDFYFFFHGVMFW